jgi:hypothetical protein
MTGKRRDQIRSMNVAQRKKLLQNVSDEHFRNLRRILCVVTLIGSVAYFVGLHARFGNPYKPLPIHGMTGAVVYTIAGMAAVGAAVIAVFGIFRMKTGRTLLPMTLMCILIVGCFVPLAI